MCGQPRPLLVLGLLCSLAFYTPSIVFAQTTMRAGFDPWDVVQETPARAELEVLLDNGSRFKGRLLSASATTLRVSRKDEIAEIHRNDVLKIYLLSPKPDDFRKMMRNTGALIGATVGLELVIAKEVGFFLIPGLGGVLGAFGGYALAKRMKSRTLIYDARPRQLPKNRGSGTDEKQSPSPPLPAIPPTCGDCQ